MSDRCVRLQNEPSPQPSPWSLLRGSQLPHPPTVVSVCLLALFSFGPVKLSPGERWGGRRSMKERLLWLCEWRGNLGIPRRPPS